MTTRIQHEYFFHHAMHHPHSHAGVALADCEFTMQPKLGTQELWSCRRFWGHWSETPHPTKEIGSKREELEITFVLIKIIILFNKDLNEAVNINSEYPLKIPKHKKIQRTNKYQNLKP